MIGGRNDTTYLDHVEKYDLAFCTWSTVAPLPKPLRCTTAVSHSGNLYVFGGETTTEIVDTAYKLVAAYAVLLCRQSFVDRTFSVSELHHSLLHLTAEGRTNLHID